MCKPNALLCLLTLIACGIHAQDGLGFQDAFRVSVRRAVEKIRIDGQADETTWKTSDKASNFREKWPNDKNLAKRKTEVRVAFDDENIYFFVVAQDTNHYVAQTLKRDNGLYDSDAISIAIDPVNQRTNGFLFSVTPYNVQSEDLVSANSSGDLNFSWDNKWFSATQRHETHWTAEIAIPFKTLRYDAAKKTWGINFFRSDLKNNQYSSWTHMPTNFNFYDFGYSGALVWEEAPPPPGTNISFIPYTTGSLRSSPEEGLPTTARFNGGFDGKVAVTSSLNLDVTVNPDFSQVEVDQQVTNLTRFNIFFPERRTFFLENDDLFSNYGIPPIKPFYSRRIGLDPNGRQIPIIGGLRLSGNISKKTRIGLLNMQTLAKGDYQAQNYTAATFNTRVQARSLVKGYFLNRQAFSDGKGWADPLDAYGRNIGIQYDFTDKAGKWNSWSGFHRSFKPGISGQDLYLNQGAQFATKHIEAVIDYSDVGEQFHTDMGFVNRIENYDAKADSTIRKGFRQSYSSFTYRLFPEGKPVIQHRFKLENFTVWNRDLSLNESNLTLDHEMIFRNTSNLTGSMTLVRNNLPFHTSFTNDGAMPLPPGSYRHMQAGLSFASDSRKRLIFKTELTAGGFFNGELLQANAMLTWRAQPWGNFSIFIEQARLRFPDPYGRNDLLLVAPRIEVNFSNSIFWTTFLQYNNQNNNFNINSRLQWRYKPMSDIFLVYTDNYFTDPFMKQKNRGVVFKMNWWLNL